MEWPCPDFIDRINISSNTYTTLYLNPVKLDILHQQMVRGCLSLLLPPSYAFCWASPVYMYMYAGLRVIFLAQPQEQSNRQTNVRQPHQPGPVASRQPPRNTPQRQASAPPAQQQNSQPAGRSSRQPTQRSPERTSPRQQGMRSAEGRSPRSQSSRTARGSSARPDQQSQEVLAVRESQPPGGDVSPASSSSHQLNQQRRATHAPQRPSSEESTSAQHASDHERAVEVPVPVHSAKRRKAASPPHPSPRKTASSRTTRQQTGSPRRDSSPRRRDSSPRRDGSPSRRDGSPRRRESSPRRRDSSPRRRDGNPRRRDGTEATRETSGTSFVVIADVHVGTTDRQNNHRAQGDGQHRQCPVESGRQTGSTGNTISRFCTVLERAVKSSSFKTVISRIQIGPN